MNSNVESKEALPGIPVPPPPPRAGYWDAELVFPWQTYLPILLLLSFASGCIDVFSVPALRVFIANNTGNLIYAALGAAQMVSLDPSTIFPVSAIIALGGSWLGSFISGLIGNHIGRKRRGLLFFDFLFQSCLIFLCVGLYYGGVVKLHDGRTEYITIALLSFSMGAQNVTVKGMGTPPTIPTQVATGAMADLVSDPRLFVGFAENRPRNERIIFVLTFFVGAVVGGLAYRYNSPQLCLLLTAIFKFLTALSILVVPGPKTAKAY